MTYDPSSILVAITRDTQNRVTSCVALAYAGLPNFSERMMAIAWQRLREIRGAVRVEVHYLDHTESYKGEPLAVFTLDDMTDEDRAQQGKYYDS